MRLSEKINGGSASVFLNKLTESYEYDVNAAAIDFVLDNWDDNELDNFNNADEYIQDLCYRFNDANAEPEYKDEEFYGQEVDYRNILDEVKKRKGLTESEKLTESFEVWQTYFNEDGTTTTEYVQSFDTYEQAQKFAEGLNRDPDCQAWVKDLNESENLKESHNQEYLYMLLDRLRQDCDYYLGNGGKNPQALWAGDEASQISKMKEIWNQLEEKPEWLTMEQIEDYAKQMGVSDDLTETTDTELQQQYDELKKDEVQALKDAGDPNPENTVGIAKRLPEEKWKELDYRGDILDCIGMIHSILTYHDITDIDELLNNKYLAEYKDTLGDDMVKKLAAQELEEFSNAIIHRGVYTDGEGVSYNSVEYKAK